MKIRCAQFVLGIVTSTSLFAGLHEEAVTHTPWPVKELPIVELIHSYSIQIDSREDLREFLSHSRWMKIGSLSIRFGRESRHNIQSEDVQRISLLLKLAAPHLERLILNLRSTGLKTSELENLTAVLREKDFPYLREFTIDIGNNRDIDAAAGERLIRVMRDMQLDNLRISGLPSECRSLD